MCLCLYLYLYYYCILFFFFFDTFERFFVERFVSVRVGFGCIISRHDTMAATKAMR